LCLLPRAAPWRSTPPLATALQLRSGLAVATRNAVGANPGATGARCSCSESLRTATRAHRTSCSSAWPAGRSALRRTLCAAAGVRDAETAFLGWDGSNAQRVIFQRPSGRVITRWDEARSALYGGKTCHVGVRARPRLPTPAWRPLHGPSWRNGAWSRWSCTQTRPSSQRYTRWRPMSAAATTRRCEFFAARASLRWWTACASTSPVTAAPGRVSRPAPGRPRTRARSLQSSLRARRRLWQHVSLAAPRSLSCGTRSQALAGPVHGAARVCAGRREGAAAEAEDAD
jgi:hypothetical protein